MTSTPMERSRLALINPIFTILLGFLFFLSISVVLAENSHRPITDIEIRENKNSCYADIESGLWGWRCKESMVAKENCALKCLSPPCYELVNESDPLEEGEKDYIRSQEYKYCLHRVSLGERLEGVRGSSTIRVSK